MRSFSLRDLTVAAVRFYALLLLFRCADMAMMTIMSVLMLDRSDQNFQMPYLLNMLLYGSAGLFLLVRTGTVVGWILPRHEHEDSEGTDSPDLLVLSFSLLGLFFLISGLEALIRFGSVWYFLPKDSLTGQRPSISMDMPVMAGPLFRTIAGIGLLIGSEGVAKLFRLIRTPARPEHEEDNRDV